MYRDRYQSSPPKPTSNVGILFPNRNAMLLAFPFLFLFGFFEGYTQMASVICTTLLRGFSSSSYGENQYQSNTNNYVSELELLGRIAKAKDTAERGLHADYGDYYGPIMDPALLQRLFIHNPISKERLVRRFMTKLIEANYYHPEYDMERDPSARARTKKSTFTWVTAGDGAAAGHGNLYDQSYTAVMGRMVSDAFSSVNVKFVERNYGMGGYTSGPELGLCMESVYGSDIDVLNWDFSLMDPADHHRVQLWASRCATLN